MLALVFAEAYDSVRVDAQMASLVGEPQEPGTPRSRLFVSLFAETISDKTAPRNYHAADFGLPLAPDSSPLYAVRSSYLSRLPSMPCTIACNCASVSSGRTLWRPLNSNT